MDVVGIAVVAGTLREHGALRGRAIAGLKTGDAARIFCRRLNAELLAVNGVYRTADDWGESLRDCAVQAWCDRGMLRVLALD